MLVWHNAETPNGRSRGAYYVNGTVALVSLGAVLGSSVRGVG